jgi:hypothetical protein
VDLAPGEYTVIAQHEQYYPVRLPGIKILDGYITELTIHLRERDTSGALSDSTLSDVYNVSMKALLDASPGDFYGRICDLISGIPLADAEVVLPDFGVAARTDEEGVFIVRTAPAGKERLDWQISHPEYETLYVNTAGADSLYAGRLMACIVPKSLRPEGETTSSTNSARFMISVFSWSGGVHTICSTAVTVGRGETFGYVQLPCRSVSDTFKLVEVNRDGTAKVDFAAHLNIGTVDSNWEFYEDMSMTGPAIVGRDPVYWRTPTIDAGEIYSLRRIR